MVLTLERGEAIVVDSAFLEGRVYSSERNVDSRLRDEYTTVEEVVVAVKNVHWRFLAHSFSKQGQTGCFSSLRNIVSLMIFTISSKIRYRDRSFVCASAGEISSPSSDYCACATLRSRIPSVVGVAAS